MLKAMQPIALATANPAKREKLRWLIEGLGLEPLTLEQARDAPTVDESGASHLEIAIAKAEAWSKTLGCLAIASDGGLVIPALGERWDSLRTRRFAGEHATDRQRIEALLKLLSPYRDGERQAFWVEAVAVAKDGRAIASWRGESPRGHIVETYDPQRLIPGFWAFSLWRLPQFGKTYAELDPSEVTQADDHWSRLRVQVQAHFQHQG
ncbi:MAG: hypothetical protein IIC82_07680 [Chloroflexi bacterium]|nr:hypothetical protein [Chloroflexota bacterium]